MSRNQAGFSLAPFEIKSASLPLVALMLKSANLALLDQSLRAEFAEQPDFFDKDALVIDLSGLPEDERDANIDFATLVSRLRRLGCVPVAVRGGSPRQMGSAYAAGLAPVQDALIAARQAAPPPAPAAAARPDLPPGAMVLDRPLRSGQQVYARGTDLVVLASVNHGAEVAADGHIHVYAALRGKAIAGATGRTDARIFAMSMEPELVSLCGVYRTSENEWPKDVWGKPAQVHLEVGPESDRLVVTPIPLS